MLGRKKSSKPDVKAAFGKKCYQFHWQLNNARDKTSLTDFRCHFFSVNTKLINKKISFKASYKDGKIYLHNVSHCE